MQTLPHLTLLEAQLLSGTEWRPEKRRWIIGCVVSGVGIFVGNSQAIEVTPGTIFCMPPSIKAYLRISIMSSMVVSWFAIDTDELGGLLSLTERRYIESAAHTDITKWVFKPDSEPAKLHQEIQETPVTRTFKRRTRMVDLFSGLVDRNQGSVTVEESLDSRSRLSELLSRVPENQLLHISLPELARELNCGERHLSRLFKIEVGVSFRSKRTELRLERAKSLLISTNEKIINIALDCGYRHLGLFSVLFKRRFKVTPSEMRRRQLREVKSQQVSPRKVKSLKGFNNVLAWTVLFPFLWHLGSFSSPAQSTNTPKPTFEVSRYEVHGNTQLPEEVIRRAFEEFTGGAVTFDIIRQGRAALQIAYRARGWVGTAVSIPPQTLTNGIVRINVLEGKLVDVLIIGNRHYSSNNIIRALGPIRTNEALNSKVFQAQLDLVNANRDRQIFPKIQPGPEPGTTTLVLDVKDRFPLHSRFELNNQSTPGTPELRGGASAQYENLWNREHTFGLQYSFSLRQMKDQAVPIWRGLDIPAIANYSTFYRWPLSKTQSIPEQIAASPDHFGYDETTRQFRLPSPSGKSELNVFASRSTTDTGIKLSARKEVAKPPFAIFSQDSGEDLSVNESAGVRWSLPGEFGKRWKSTLFLGLELKKFQLRSFNTNNFLFRSEIPPEVPGFPSTVVESSQASPQPARSYDITYLPLSLQEELVRPDQWGVWSFRGGLTLNTAGGPLSSHTAYRGPSGSTNASGTFCIAQATVSREQRIHEEWSVLLRMEGQWASEPLISNEQYAIGGTAGPRGYIEGERFGDHGFKAIVEPRLPTFDIGMVDGTMPMKLRLSVFSDFALSELLEPSGRTKIVRMWSTGIAAASNVGSHFDFRVNIGWPLLDGPISKAMVPRVYFGLAAQF